MDAKLTLKLDQMVIDSAKKYSADNKRSLSKLVEDYFRNLTIKNVPSKKYSPLIESLTGVISESDLEEFAQEDERVRYILRIDR